MTAGWLKELRALREQEPKLNDIGPLYQEMIADNNDRGAALIAQGLIENRLIHFLRSRLVHLTETEDDSLFGRDAPLSTFSDQIKIAHAFGLIDSEVRNDLERIREIRNTIAHTPLPLSFSTPAIANACKGFHADWGGHKNMPWDKYPPRTAYLGVAGRLTRLLGQGSAANTKIPLRYGAKDAAPTPLPDK